MKLALLFSVLCLESGAAQVPDNLKPPETEALLLKAVGKGTQIYTCKATSADADARFEWVLDKPDAQLFDERSEPIGTHYKGPTWEAMDGSKVIGEVVQRAKSPRLDAVPWLLLKTKATEGGGRFGRVTYVQRVNTIGGSADRLRRMAAIRSTSARSRGSGTRPITIFSGGGKGTAEGTA